MATIKCPTNVTSITFATSGVKVPDAAGLVTEITPGEATGLVRGGSVQGGGNLGSAMLMSTAANGDVVISLPAVITGITIGGVAYTVNGVITPWGKILNAAVPATAATILLSQNFILVTG